MRAVWACALVLAVATLVAAARDDVHVVDVPAGAAYGLPERDEVMARKRVQRREAVRLGHRSDAHHKNVDRARSRMAPNPRLYAHQTLGWDDMLEDVAPRANDVWEDGWDDASFVCNDNTRVVTAERGSLVLLPREYGWVGCSAVVRPASGRCMNITVVSLSLMARERLVVHDGSGVGPPYVFESDMWGDRQGGSVVTSAPLAVIAFNTGKTPAHGKRWWRIEYEAVDECSPCSVYGCMACSELDHCSYCEDTGVCAPQGTCTGHVIDQPQSCPHFLPEAGALRAIAHADFESKLNWGRFLLVPLAQMDPHDYCQYDGITCSPDFRVVALTIVDTDINPDSPTINVLTNFRELRHLEMENCALTGTIPAAMAELPLVDVLLHNNFIEGTIPPELGATPTLRRLILANNLLYGTLPAQLLQSKSLVFLDVRHNVLLGTLPDMRGATALLVFSADINGLTGSIDSARLGPALRALHLSGNNLSGVLPDVLPPEMRRFSVNQNSVTGPLPESWPESVPELAEVYADGNSLLGTLPEAWKRFEKLVHVELGHNALYGPLPDWSSLPLTTLTLEDNFLSGTLSTGALNPRLLDLYLGLNYLTGTIPDFSELCPNLYALHLGGNHLHGTVPRGLLAMEHLTELALHTNEHISGTLPPLHAPRLIDIAAANTNVSGTIDGSYFNSSLLYLDVHATAISGIGHIPRDTVMTVLDVSQAKLQEFPVEVLRVAHADLSHNAMVGTDRIAIVHDAGNRITSLAVANCALSGPVPDLYLLPQLNLFDGRFNFFSAWDYVEQTSHVATLLLGGNEIVKDPDVWNTYAQLRSPSISEVFPDLVQLDISYNKFLHVPIPSSWGRLSKLQSLNIERSGLRAMPEDRNILGFVCGTGALRDMCWPRFLNASRTASASQDGKQLCYGLERVGGALSVAFDKVVMGDEYFHGLNCLCARGLYYDASSNGCVECMRNAVCPGRESGLIRAAMPGYYGSPTPEDPVGMVRCKLRGVCAPLVNGEVSLDVHSPCIKGRTGRMCSRCDDGYYLLGETCVKCGEEATKWVVPTLFALILVAFVGYLYVARNNSAGLLKVTLFYLQVLKLLPHMGAPLPSYLLGSTQSTSSLSLHLSGMECLFPGYDHVSQFYVVALTPLVMVVLVGAVYLLGLLHERARANLTVWRAINFRVALCLLFAAYLLVVTTVFRALPCEKDPFSALYYFNNAPYIECAADVDHSPLFRKLAILLVFTHVLGLPLFFGVLLWRQRHNRFRKLVALKYGFLYEGYRLRMWWWELVILVRRIVIALIVSLQDNDSAVLPMFVLFTLLASLLLQRHYLPFTTPLDNALETASLMVLIVSYATVIAFFDDHLRYKDLLAIMIIILNVCVTVILVAALARRRMAFLSRWVKRAETSILVNPYGSSRDIGAEAGLDEALLEMHRPISMSLPAAHAFDAAVPAEIAMADPHN